VVWDGRNSHLNSQHDKSGFYASLATVIDAQLADETDATANLANAAAAIDHSLPALNRAGFVACAPRVWS